MFIIIGLLGSGLALSIPILRPMFSPTSPAISGEDNSHSSEMESTPAFGKPQKPEGIIRVVGIGVSPDRSIAQSKAKMDAYYKLAQKFGLNPDRKGKTEIILTNTRIIRYKSYKKGKNYVYECYLEKLPDN
jgi:hypothetical protein